jgi:hypothetical protein
VTIALFLGVLFELGRREADDLGGSSTTSPKMAAGNAQNSNLLFSKVGLVQSLSNLQPDFFKARSFESRSLRTFLRSNQVSKTSMYPEDLNFKCLGCR